MSSPALAQTGNADSSSTPAAAASAQVPAAPAGDADAEAAGKKLYYQNCTRCHGLNMVAASAAFFDLRKFPREDKERFVASVTNGKRAMPAWGEKLSSAEIDQLWAYVMTAQK